MLVIQLETVLVAVDALGAFNLRIDAARRLTAIAIAVVALMTAGQLSITLWRHSLDARKRLLDRRAEMEVRVFSDRPATPHDLRSDQRFEPAQRSSFLSFTLPAIRIRMYKPADVPERIASRFGFEPTWAYQVLDESGIPAARRLTRQAELVDARAAGQFTALVIALLAASGLPLAVDFSSHGAWIALAAILLLLLARLAAYVRTGREFFDNEGRYYQRLERMLELHRFELYRALAVKAPQNADEEKLLSLNMWRQGRGGIRYDLPGPQHDSEVSYQVQELTELLQGPELVAYEGFVSWLVRDSRVQLVFSRLPMPEATSAHIEVQGSNAEMHAPFEITANSAELKLLQLRCAIQAPVDGRPARATFGFVPLPVAEENRPAVIWFEIRQQGRFIQLLRVQVTPDRDAEPLSSTPNGND